ncbi:MAG: putative lipid II flippase FtsW [Verrucomicrobiota bacterium]|nr:putative lipid II flippase FtsW [Verrucomicrobiota bacterium]
MKFATTTFAFCVAALLALGMTMLYSASMLDPVRASRSLEASQVGAQFLKMQLIWCGLGLIGCIMAANLDYGRLKKFSWPLLILSIVLLALVLLPQVGIKINGAKRWLGFGHFRFQPSEFAKIALLIFLAYYGEKFRRQMGKFKKGLLIPGLIICIVLILIFLEPDVGNTMLLALVSSFLLLIAGLRLRYFLPPVLLGALALGFFISQDPMRSARIYSWLHLEETKLAKGHQAYQAMIALGNGGWTGLGLGNGRQKLGFIPEHHTDFIFSIIGEELGLIATLGVVFTFVVMVICGFFIASRARDPFGLLLGSGITLMIGIQAFINIGVVTGVLPNKGMPLPFISYGGSNLLMLLCAVGIMLNIARHSVERERIKTSKNPFVEFREISEPQKV